MGNNSSNNRRNGRIQHNPVGNPPLPPRGNIPPPPGYPGNAGAPTYPVYPNGHHNMPYHMPYPPTYNGAMPTPMGNQFYQNFIPAGNGHLMMNYPTQPMYRPTIPTPHPQQIPPTPVAEAQKANTIRNDVNLKKPTLRLEKDEENPGFYLVAFTFDATVAGSISIFFLAKEGDRCSLTPLKPHLYKPIRVPFEKGLGQKFKQAPGTGVNLALFDERELSREGPDDVYPLLVRAETEPKDPSASASLQDELPPGAELPKYIHSQTTHAIVEKNPLSEGYKVKVLKQTIWVDGIRYDLQEIYGIENSGGNTAYDGSDAGKECVICMSEPRDTTVLPCRHMFLLGCPMFKPLKSIPTLSSNVPGFRANKMAKVLSCLPEWNQCMCSECAKVLRFQTNRCPICRTPVERLLEIKVPKNDAEDYVFKSRSFKGASASQSSSSASQSTTKDDGALEIKVPKVES
ncbi:hypothetical protein AXG93_2752s1940 [Marchantia polymorpha subsp. ruderalis]|uniref:RING-type E3 ubiquitin transferase n=1 Tax=Marchantia polymorpha subsp. ruderalis TaxID=1480154 RepID=A0A176VTN7_MARPO|nr:hypothetical protein AXG93_2752s1940 [Marchantia polymorpha subsp. ruderalis]